MVIKIIIYFIIIFFLFVNEIKCVDKCKTRELNKSNKLIIIKSTLSYRLYESKNVQECVCVTYITWGDGLVRVNCSNYLLSALMLSQLTATK